MHALHVTIQYKHACIACDNSIQTCMHCITSHDSCKSQTVSIKKVNTNTNVDVVESVDLSRLQGHQNQILSFSVELRGCKISGSVGTQWRGPSHSGVGQERCLVMMMMMMVVVLMVNKNIVDNHRRHHHHHRRRHHHHHRHRHRHHHHYRHHHHRRRRRHRTHHRCYCYLHFRKDLLHR